MTELLATYLERSKQPRSVALAARGEYLKDLAWDARGAEVAANVTDRGWRRFAARLAEARAALEQAWDLDQANAFAAAEMITVCMGEGGDRAEMEKWFKRAMAADPGNYEACGRKLYYLEPKWHGSQPAMILFGREMAAAGAADPRVVRPPLILVDAHWNLARSARGRGADYPTPDYFKDNPDAWSDVSGVYETFLKRVPDSRYHRTRYAVIAAWAGHRDVTATQFDRLGDRTNGRVVPAPVLAPLRPQAKAKADGR